MGMHRTWMLRWGYQRESDHLGMGRVIKKWFTHIFCKQIKHGKNGKALYAFQQKMHLCRNAVQNPWPLLKTHIHTAANQLIEKYNPKHGMILEFISALDDSQ